MDNRRALPPPEISDRPGPKDWVTKGSPVFDGDYITLRCNAWDGMTAYHSWNSGSLRADGDVARPTETRNKRTPQSGEGLRSGEGGPERLSLARVRMDNRYSFCIRKVVFDQEKQAYVVPSWDAWKDRKPIAVTDTVVLLVPNDPKLALGTRNPSTSYGNNGDYAVGLYEFPLATRADLDNSGVSGAVAQLISLGFWQNGVDFLNQSRCIWTFNNVYDRRANLVYGGNVINIQNMWTKVKSGAVGFADFLTLAGPVTPIMSGINASFNSGRNLAIHDSWADGKILRLSLISNDHADTEGWIIDGWHGNTYPVQRAMIPVEPIPSPPPGIEPQPVYIPNLTDQIQNPPPVTQGNVVDAITGTAGNQWLENATAEQNPLTWLDHVAKAVYGRRWVLLTYVEQITLTGLVGLGIFAGVEIAIKEI